MDYAVIAQLSGFDPSRRAMVLAVTTTYETQAVVEFVCREASAAELLAKLEVKSRAAVPLFEAPSSKFGSRAALRWNRTSSPCEPINEHIPSMSAGRTESLFNPAEDVP